MRLLILIAVIWAWAWAQFLPVDQAFQLQSQQQGHWLLVDVSIAPEHYVYQKNLSIQVPEGVELGEMIWQQSPQWLYDPFFKQDLAVFFQRLRLAIPLATANLQEITLTYQGCAQAGLCYPPQRVPLIVTATDNATLPQSLLAPFEHAGLNQPEPSQASVEQTLPATLGTSSGLLGFLQQLSLWQALLMFYVLGLALTFTPCVLPMVPILSAIVMGAGQRSRWGTLALSLSYVLPMALTYALLGLVLASLGAGANITASLQRAEVLLLLALVFLLLAMFTLGWLRLPIPSAMRHWLQQMQSKPQGGHYLGVASMGVLSALVVSPCVSAPLAAVLLFIAINGEQMQGFYLLLSLGLGMGTPLLLVAQGGAHWLPKSGSWLDRSKEVLAAMMLLLALWLVGRLLSGPWLLWLYGASVLAAVTYVGYWLKGWQAWQRYVGYWLLALVASYGLAMMLGGYLGHHDWRRPLVGEQSSLRAHPWRDTSDPSELSAWLNQSEPSMVFVSADWCVSCRVMKRDVFANAEVQQQLSDWQWLTFDISEATSEQLQWLDEHGVFGPPALLFFDQQGQWLSHLSLQGEVSRAAFLRFWLSAW